MKDLKEFNIPFVGLKDGSHLFEYQISKKFFERFNFEDYNDCNVNITLDFLKKSNMLELSFEANGHVNIPCDVTSELFDQKIDGNLHLLVRFGHEYNDDNEEILILPHDEYQINVAQYIYEMIILAVPTKRVHPKVIDGSMKSETLDKLDELSIQQDKPVDEKSTDPRWDKLKNLLTDK